MYRRTLYINLVISANNFSDKINKKAPVQRSYWTTVPPKVWFSKKEFWANPMGELKIIFKSLTLRKLIVVGKVHSSKLSLTQGITYGPQRDTWAQNQE